MVNNQTVKSNHYLKIAWWSMLILLPFFVVFMFGNSFAKNVLSFFHNQSFVVKDFVVNNRKETPVSFLKDIFADYANKSIFVVNEKDLIDKLKGYPTVLDVNVTKSFPNKIIVDIYETKPKFLWYKNDKRTDYVFLDDDFNEIRVKKIPNEFMSLPIIFNDTSFENVKEIITTLNNYPLIANKVNRIDRLNNRRWNLVYDSVTKIYLPETGVSEALKSLEVEQARIGVLDKKHRVVDLRLQNKIVLSN